MFRKIVSNLSFSPALVGQLAFYAKRLRKEESTRRVGLVFVALALVVQGFAIFDPPQSANASTSGDFVNGGLGLGSKRSINNFLSPYDSNYRNLQDIMNYTGITRDEIAAAQYGSFLTAHNDYSWGHNPNAGTQAITITDPTGTQNITTVYARDITIINGVGTRIYGWIGHSTKVGWFALMQACGNLVTNVIPTPPTPPTPAKIVQTKTASNISEGSIDATTVIAKADDQIKFTISATNNGGSAAKVSLADNLADVLEYATIVDYGGGTLNATSKVLTWPDVSLAPGATQSRDFLIKVLDTIPSAPQGQSDASSYDCKMQNQFGVLINIRVDCQPPKIVEQTVTQLPHTGPTENLIFAGVVLAVVVYFYARSRQVGKEVRLIRRDLNAGAF
jgi:hypothetical protein